ncbi:uncharacterized protein LOC119457088 [Dermacentor silvarum]|uniref:uncharacterized protein LOC119457088 n=1 Tax=Dermacentor silvarum TaxID=543639 RepID=UPI0021010EF1|nr:uncharacterized protein LOC119457088 [Dermacentor silvarum]
MDEPEGSSYESTISGSPEIKEKRWLPVPTVKGVFMFVGVVMIIGVLGMAGYIFYKGPDAKAKRLVASKPATNPSSGSRVEEDPAFTVAAAEPMSTKKAKKPHSNPSKKKRSVPAGSAKKKNKAKKGGHKRSYTQNLGPQNAPLEADADDDDNDGDEGEKADDGKKTDEGEKADDGKKTDEGEKAGDLGASDVKTTTTVNDEQEILLLRWLCLIAVFNGDPSCTTSHDIYQCEGDEQLQMFVSHLCMSNSKGGTCFDWRPQRLCLTSQSNRFRSVQECEENCNAGNNKCGPAATCECSGMYRKVNYIYDMRRQRCRLIPVHECAEVDVGFTDSDECESKCGSDTSKEDTRCKLAALEELVRPCLWEDKLYTHYFDAKSGKCQPWDESVCSSKVFRRLDKCFSGCSRGVIGDASQQENTTTGNTTTDRRVVRAQRAPPGAAKVIT